MAAILRAATAERTGAALRANGRPCRRGSQCASGLCAGPKGKKKCRQARNQGICTIASNAGAREPIDTSCQSPTFSGRCLCWVTTSGRSFCGKAAPETCGCGADNKCGNIPGAVCVERFSCGFAGPPTACVLPCPVPA